MEHEHGINHTNSIHGHGGVPINNDPRAEVVIASSPPIIPHSPQRGIQSTPPYPLVHSAGGGTYNAPVHLSPHPSPSEPLPNQKTTSDGRMSEKFYLLPGISERSRLLHETSAEKSYDYRHMFHTLTPPLPDMVDKFYEVFYETVGQIIYYILSFIITPIILLVLGIVSGLLNFVFAWITSPVYNLFEVVIPRLARPLKVILKHIVSPFFLAVGAVYGGIRVKHSKVPVHDSNCADIV